MLRPSTGPPYASPNLCLDGTIDMRMLTSHEGERQGGQFWACSSARVMGVGLDCVGFICSCHVSLLPTFNIHYISEGPLLIILLPATSVLIFTRYQFPIYTSLHWNEGCSQRRQTPIELAFQKSIHGCDSNCPKVESHGRQTNKNPF